MENELDNSRWFCCNPALETETLFLFNGLSSCLPASCAIEGDRGTFLDCLAFRIGQMLGIEFEWKVVSFFDHEHEKDEKLVKCKITIFLENRVPTSIKRGENEFTELRIYLMSQSLMT